MMRIRILAFWLLIIWVVPCLSQTSSKNDELKFNADYFLMRNEFSKALDLYLKVLASEPENCDIKYRIGVCFLNSENGKEKAIPYLKEASENVSENYSTNSFKETHAPIETFFLLGSAYRVDNQLDEAIDAYEKYKSYLSPHDDYNRNVADQYIKNCRLAKDMIKKPHDVTFTNLGRRVNDEKANFNPVVSGDGRILVFSSPSKHGYDIFISTYNDTSWSVPANITVSLGGGKYLRTSSLSNDGNTLILDLEDPENSDLYMSYYKKGRWTKAEPMVKAINSKWNETNGSLSSDGNTFFFTSNRKGGLGDLDIYRCTLQNGIWSEAQNLGSSVNTPYNEETPFASADDRTLFFSSEGHEGMGGYDVFKFDLSAEGKGVENLGFPINTTENNLFFVPLNDGSKAFYAFRGADSYGGRDIYSVEIHEEPALAQIASLIDPSANPEPMVGTGLGLSVPDSVASDGPGLSVPEPVATDRPGLSVPEPVASGKSSFAIQFMALRNPVDLRYFAGLKDISVTLGRDAWYRYTFPFTTDSMTAARARSELISKGFRDAFIRRINFTPRYTIQVMAVPGPVTDLNRFSDLPEISVWKDTDTFCRYTTGGYETKEEALDELQHIRAMGYPKAFIRKVRFKEER